jgi:hypothetical protein
MKRFAALCALALAVGMAGASVASALDFCLPGTGVVLKKFKIPTKGKCVTVAGTFDDGRTSGTACTDSAGTHVSFSLHSMIPNGSVLDDFVDLALPAVGGTYSGTDSYRSNYGPLLGPVSESASYCPPQPVS